MFITFSLATPTDDAELRRILRENPMPGAISLSFEREPDYFRGAVVEGSFQQTIVAREQEHSRVIGMGGRSVRELFVNGAIQPIGYMSQLRVDRSYDWGLALPGVIAQGFAFYRRLHADGRTPFYLTSIIADNEPAVRLLTAGLRGYPCLHPYTRMNTFAIYPGRRKRVLPLPSNLRLAQGNADLIPAIVECLERNAAGKQFAPHWTASTLCQPAHTPDLTPEDFFLALDGDRVVGCLAGWDQSGFKQTVVRGYSKTLARGRRILNLAAKLGGWPVLPPLNTPFRVCFASHLAVDNDEPAVFAALLRALYNHAVARAYSYVMLGLAENHPLCPLVTASYQHVKYVSQIYLTGWEDGFDAVAQVDQRLSGLEIGLL